LNVEVAFNSLQALLRVNNRPPFVPPEEFSLPHIEKLWNKLAEEETKRQEWIRKEIERQHRLEQLATRFWRKAAALLTWGEDNSNLLSNPDYGSSVAEVEAKLKNHSSFEANYQYSQRRVDTTKSIGEDLIAQGYGRSNDVRSKIHELDSMWLNVKSLSDARRSALEQELLRQKNLDELRLQFANRGRKFITYIEDADDEEITASRRANSLDAIKQLQAILTKFLVDYGRQEEEYNSLLQFNQSMIEQGITNNPYTSYDADAITERWTRLNSEVSERQGALNTEEQRLIENDNLCKQFATHAKALLDWVEKEKEAINRGTSGSLEEQLHSLGQRKDKIAANTQIHDLKNLHNTIEQRNITFNPYTEESIETLTLAYESLNNLVAKQTRTIEKEILNQSGSKVSVEQLAEFKNTFKAFDKDRSNTLEKHELAACLKALGQNVTDEQVDRIVASVGKATPGKIIFQEFVDYMVSKTEDSDSPSTVKNAFRVVAQEKNFVTEDDLKRVPGMDRETVEFLVHHMPKEGSHGLSYNAFTDSQYNTPK